MISAESLKGFGLFSELNEAELAKIAKLCHERTYEDRAVIFTIGGFAKDVYLLKTGKVDIQIEFKIYDNEIVTTVYTVGNGEIFGWSALVPPHRLTASARCERKSEVVTINGKEFLELLERERNIGYVVMKNLSGLISSRLAATTIALRHEIQKLTQK
ncbi:MAG: cyclic nucleotide-binding domain-containing protein [Deltaproteobacteria bacterium]|nr:cyclic nucleotide-binding domain-containing protein [Deltaproteobacteria bacterium]MBM4324296.1 cyclic nucleotide-binding domain-containing protein [Deltaproteobacteria bacterium]